MWNGVVVILKTRKYVTFALELKGQEGTGKPMETVSGVLDNMGTMLLQRGGN